MTLCSLIISQAKDAETIFRFFCSTQILFPFFGSFRVMVESTMELVLLLANVQAQVYSVIIIFSCLPPPPQSLFPFVLYDFLFISFLCVTWDITAVLC